LKLGESGGKTAYRTKKVENVLKKRENWDPRRKKSKEKKPRFDVEAVRFEKRSDGKKTLKPKGEPEISSNENWKREEKNSSTVKEAVKAWKEKGQPSTRIFNAKFPWGGRGEIGKQQNRGNGNIETNGSTPSIKRKRGGGTKPASRNNTKQTTDEGHRVISGKVGMGSENQKAQKRNKTGHGSQGT